MEKNIRAVLNHTYDDYCIMIVTDSAEDPAYAVAKAVLAQYPKAKADMRTS